MPFWGPQLDHHQQRHIVHQRRLHRVLQRTQDKNLLHLRRSYVQDGQAERANALILKVLKTRAFDRLKKSSRQWVDELCVHVHNPWSIEHVCKFYP